MCAVVVLCCWHDAFISIVQFLCRHCNNKVAPGQGSTEALAGCLLFAMRAGARHVPAITCDTDHGRSLKFIVMKALTSTSRYCLKQVRRPCRSAAPHAQAMGPVLFPVVALNLESVRPAFLIPMRIVSESGRPGKGQGSAKLRVHPTCYSYSDPTVSFRSSASPGRAHEIASMTGAGFVSDSSNHRRCWALRLCSTALDVGVIPPSALAPARCRWSHNRHLAGVRDVR